MPDIEWNDEPSAGDIADAIEYLRLVTPGGLVGDVEFGAPLMVPAKDVLRAAGLYGAPLPRTNAGVKKYLDRIKKGTPLNPTLNVRGNLEMLMPLETVEGFHRTCAVWHTDESGLVRCFFSE